MTKTSYFEPPIPRVFAHRGFSYLVPGVDENTTESFRTALDRGASHIETDTQATLDGVAVLLLDRVYRSRAIIAAHTVVSSSRTARYGERGK